MTKYADLTSAKTTFTSLFDNIDISEQIKGFPNGSYFQSVTKSLVHPKGLDFGKNSH